MTRGEGGTGNVSVTVNGEHHGLAAGTTLADLVARLAHDGRGVAVALDQVVIPRSAWHDVVLEEGAVVEVVGAAAGG